MMHVITQKHRLLLAGQRYRPGFALPTILIASVVMLIVMTAALSAAVASRSTLETQHYNQLASGAAESGLAMAIACLESDVTAWTSPLRPNTSCSGGASCTNSSNCYVLQEDSLRTSFQVAAFDSASAGTKTIVATGKVELIRKSDASTFREFTTVSKVDVGGTGGGASGGSLLSERETLSAGEDHSCAIGADNWAYCWGRGTSGRLGTGGVTNQSTPTPVSTSGDMSGNVLQVSAGMDHTCAVASDGDGYCWGNNTYDKLGIDNKWVFSSNTPRRIVMNGALNGLDLLQIGVGQHHACALASDHKVYCWGRNANRQVGNGGTSSSYTTPQQVVGGELGSLDILHLSVGALHNCVIASDYNAYCWGHGANNRLGRGSSTTDASSPVAVSRPAPLNGLQIKQLSAGGAHTCVIASDNQVYCWGNGANGRLGRGNTSSSNVPVAVSTTGALNGKTMIGITAGQEYSTGGAHTCAIDSNNKTYCWGDNDDGQIGIGTKSATVFQTSPVAVHSPIADQSAVWIAATESATCALALNNTLYCWGDNTNDQLGLGTTVDYETPTPVPGFTPLISVPPAAPPIKAYTYF